MIQNDKTMNKEQAEEKKRIKKEVQARIGKGEPKQQILEELSQQYKDKITIVKQLESTPSMAMKWKYLNYNHAMSALILIVFVLDIFALYLQLTGKKDYISFAWIRMLPYLNVFIDILLLAGVLRYRIETYSWIAARAVVSVVQIIVIHAYYKNIPIDFGQIIDYIVLALLLISFVLGLFLGVKLCPPRVPKIIEVDIDGSEKINKTVYVFPD